MHTFEIIVELKSGYHPVMSTTAENEVRLYVQAPNRVTANRMAHALLDDNANVETYDITCCDGSCDLYKEQ